MNNIVKINNKGFTLVELLVVIAIIAILAVVGVTVFSGTQANARDARRKADIEAISKAYESKYNSTTAQYPVLTGGDFASGALPKDPSTGADYSGLLGAVAASYNVCATIEAGGTYCRASQQQ